jgi:hypothetical protein
MGPFTEAWLVAGFLLKDPISFGYNSPNRAPQNTRASANLTIHLCVLIGIGPLFVFPTTSRSVGGKAGTCDRAEATWYAACVVIPLPCLPLSLGGGDVIVRPGLPPLNFCVTEQWTVKRLMFIQSCSNG